MNFRKWLGGEEVINAYCHKLALDGGKRLAGILGTEVLDKTGEFTLNMASPVSPSFCAHPTDEPVKTTVRLPLPTEAENSKYYAPDTAADILKLLTRASVVDRNFASPTFVHAGAWWTRCSAQVWNEASILLFAVVESSQSLILCYIAVRLRVRGESLQRNLRRYRRYRRERGQVP